MPLLTLEVRLEPDVRAGPAAGPPDRRAAGLRPARPDAHRDGHVGDRPQRLSVRRRGQVEFQRRAGAAPGSLIRVRERGPGIKDLQAILDGRYVSTTGTGRRDRRRPPPDGPILDRSDPGPGPPSRWRRCCPGGACLRYRSKTSPDISAELAQYRPQGLARRAPAAEPGAASVPYRNSGKRQAEIARMHTRELDETNRGVRRPLHRARRPYQGTPAALGPEIPLPLEMSHELRSPLNSILQPVRLPAGPQRRRPDRRTGEASPLHPQGCRGPARPGQRPPRPGQGRGWQGRHPTEAVRGGQGLFDGLRGTTRARCWLRGRSR